jgi:hypothetical protein
LLCIFSPSTVSWIPCLGIDSPDSNWVLKAFLIPYLLFLRVSQSSVTLLPPPF